MNIKKSFLVALAAATAVSTVSALTVSAAGLGETTNKVEDTQTVVAGQETEFKAQLQDVDININIPADVLPEGEYTFNADIVVNQDVQDAIDKLNIKESEILDLYFADAAGAHFKLTDAGVQVTLETDKYNAVYVYEDSTKTLTKLDSTKEGNKLTFIAPHFSYYVLANEPETSGTTSTTSTTSTTGTTTNTPGSTTTTTTGTTTTTTGDTGKGDSVTTGDAATTTTVAVFAVMGVVALGTAVVASKMKKASK